MMMGAIAGFLLSGMPATNDASGLMSRVDATRSIAACVLKRDRTDAIAIAGSEPATPRFDKAAGRIDAPLTACLDPDMRSLLIRINDLRGVFAETLLKEADGGALARARALPVIPPRRIELGKSQVANDAALFRCVAGADPQRAASLVEAAPGSVEEASAFRGLSPALQSCVPANAAMQLKAFQVRLLVAASLYGRLADLSGA
ncbi:MAG: hypothetical protein B7Y45_09885 [Sphingomonas sp. 28-66-16]|nr:MAG: hypothetical protein B7Y45_09885 [Sphingomonas sp. 28-66-16]